MRWLLIRTLTPHKLPSQKFYKKSKCQIRKSKVSIRKTDEEGAEGRRVDLSISDPMSTAMFLS